MPELNWIGKQAVVKHHQEVPFRLLEPDSELSCGDPQSGNLIVEGDNLHALKALLPRYAGKVKCIYIDPPYNTGEDMGEGRGWVYSDNVNSPLIQKWLGQVVGKEAEDLSRHDKWLCMMYPRLSLLRQFLSDDGFIFISIDDNEVSSLRLLMHELFSRNNFIAEVVWQKRTSPDARRPLGDAHEYIVAFAKDFSASKKKLKKVPLTAARSKDFKNLDNDPRGPWASVDITGQTGHATDDQFYEIETPSGERYRPPQGRCWAMAEATFRALFDDGRIWFGKSGGGEA